MTFLLFHLQYQERNHSKAVLSIAQGTNVPPTLARACRYPGGIPKTDISTRDSSFINEKKLLCSFYCTQLQKPDS